MTETAGAASESSDTEASEDSGDVAGDATGRRTGSALRERSVLVLTALLIYYVTLTFVARPYLIPSESMEPTLHGCAGCVGDRIMVDKLTYRFTDPRPGDVVVFRGPPEWNKSYRSIRSHNRAVRWVQNVLSFIGFVPPDENDLVKRVIAVGGQQVQCRNDTGLTVDGKTLDEPYLDLATMEHDPRFNACMAAEFGPVDVPEGRLWVMGDNRMNSADSRVHCDESPRGYERNILCTGPNTDLGTVPVGNVIGKARFIAWPPGRWGGVDSTNPQRGSE